MPCTCTISGLRRGWTALCALTLVALAACAPALPPQPVQVAAPPAAPAPAVMIPQAPLSDVARHFAALEARRLGQGLLRTDPAPRDLPHSARDLEEVFVRVALREEYVLGRASVQQRETVAPLRRWEGPVRMGLSFGPSVPQAVQDADTRHVQAYAGQLARASRHPVSLARAPNFHILVLSEDERRASGARLRALVAGIDPLAVQIVTQMPLSVSCLVLAFSRSGDNVYTDAIAVIRAELPDLSRKACYHEELAQGLGLSNDSPRARPSLFNDAAEFAVLTDLDRDLLALLYDPRLRPGMTEAQALPLIRTIASELKGGTS